MTARKLTVAERLGMMAKALEFSAVSTDRMANDAMEAALRRSSENVSLILRHLVTAMEAAVRGRFGALEALAQDCEATMCNERFLNAMELRLAEAVPVLAFTDEQEGGL